MAMMTSTKDDYEDANITSHCDIITIAGKVSLTCNSLARVTFRKVQPGSFLEKRNIKKYKHWYLQFPVS